MFIRPLRHLLEDGLGQRVMAVNLAKPHKLVAPHNNKKWFLLVCKGVNLLPDLLVGLVLNAVDVKMFSPSTTPLSLTGNIWDLQT